MPRSRDPRDKLPSQRGAKRTGPIGSILPGDDTEVARDIQRLWLEIHRLRPGLPDLTIARIRPVVSVTDVYTASIGYTVVADGTFTVSLPSVTGSEGEDLVIKNGGIGTITVAQFVPDTIDGSAANVILAANHAIWLVSSLAGWIAIAGYP